MTVTVNRYLCSKCGVCISHFQGFCMNPTDGYPAIDYAICNQCQKCITICPNQAILMNGQGPEKITAPLHIEREDLKELLRRRRSCKKFKDVKIPREILADMASVAAYAPNQNKNIEIIIVDDPELIAAIDTESLKLTRRFYKALFSVKFLTGFYQLFSKSLKVIRMKMERSLHTQKTVVKENTNAMFITIGDPKVAVTAESAPYLLANIIVYTEALGLSSCLMDALKLSINFSKGLKRRLGIPKGYKVFGVLLVGYSNEKIVNIPVGYEIKVHWNGRS
ncbi:MAG TPA: nitroreductase family protein [Bacillota bacterium]|nr:nitroreductase family protein [Bacillota bacterium]